MIMSRLEFTGKGWSHNSCSRIATYWHTICLQTTFFQVVYWYFPESICFHLVYGMCRRTISSKIHQQRWGPTSESRQIIVFQDEAIEGSLFFGTHFPKVWLIFVGCSCLSRILCFPKIQFFLLAKILWQLVNSDDLSVPGKQPLRC